MSAVREHIDFCDRLATLSEPTREDLEVTTRFVWVTDYGTVVAVYYRDDKLAGVATITMPAARPLAVGAAPGTWHTEHVTEDEAIARIERFLGQA